MTYHRGPMHNCQMQCDITHARLISKCGSYRAEIILNQQHYGYADTTSTTCVIPKYQLQVIQANTKLAIRHMDYLKTFVRSYNSSCSHALEASGRMYNPSLRSFKHPCSHALDSPGGIREASSSPPIRRTLILVRESDEHYEY